MCALCSAHITILDLIILIIFGEKGSCEAPYYSFLQLPIISSLSCPNILVSTLFWNILGLRSSSNVGDQVSHPYTIRGKITFYKYILIFTILDSRREDKKFWTEWEQALIEFNLLVNSSWTNIYKCKYHQIKAFPLLLALCMFLKICH
jgi:hypothetical protein